MVRPRRRFWLGKKDKRYGGRSATEKQKPIAAPSFNRIGTSDTSFLDSISTVYYPWLEINPLYKHDATKPTGRPGRISSLKNICARSIAANVSQLQGSSLQSVPKPCVRLIWNQIMVSHNDTFEMFVVFATLLHESGLFRCHPPLLPAKDELTKLRNDILHNHSIPGMKHRIENLFNNIRFDHLQIYLNSLKFQSSIFLDLSFSPKLLTIEDYICIFKIKNLAGLDLSNHYTLDDRILSFLITAIRTGRLPKLRVLRLFNCRGLTKSVFESITALPESESNNLSLVLCDKLFHEDFQTNLMNRSRNRTSNPIIGTKWSVYPNEWDNSDGRILKRLPLASQYWWLHHKFSHLIPNPTSGEEDILLDIMVHDQPYEPNSSCFMLESVSRNRRNSRERCDNPQLLMIDVQAEIKPVIGTTNEPKRSADSVFSSVTTNQRRPAKKRMKPRVKRQPLDDY